jgi:hypothetical protein
MRRLLKERYKISTTGQMNAGWVTYEGLILPRDILIQLEDNISPPGDKIPTLSISVRVTESRARIDRVVFIGGADLGSIKQSHLRNLEFDQVVEQAIAAIGLRLDDDGRFEMSTRELLEVGKIYCNPENRRAPAQMVQLKMGYNSRPTADRRIKEARKQGWVPPVGASVEELANHFDKIMKEERARF